MLLIFYVCNFYHDIALWNSDRYFRICPWNFISCCESEQGLWTSYIGAGNSHSGSRGCPTIFSSNRDCRSNRIAVWIYVYWCGLLCLGRSNNKELWGRKYSLIRIVLVFQKRMHAGLWFSTSHLRMTFQNLLNHRKLRLSHQSLQSRQLLF